MTRVDLDFTIFFFGQSNDRRGVSIRFRFGFPTGRRGGGGDRQRHGSTVDQGFVLVGGKEQRRRRKTFVVSRNGDVEVIGFVLVATMSNAEDEEEDGEKNNEDESNDEKRRISRDESVPVEVERGEIRRVEDVRGDGTVEGGVPLHILAVIGGDDLKRIDFGLIESIEQKICP